MSKSLKVAKKFEIPNQSAICVELEGKQIALFNLDGEFYAIEDTCTHQSGPLSEGEIMGEEVECPWHGAHFNIKSGEVIEPPALISLKKYNLRVIGDDIEIEL